MIPLLSLISSGSVSAANRSETTHVAWVNRLTWGVSPSMEFGSCRPETECWLSRQLNAPSGDLPPEAAAQIATMRITKTPMAQLVVEMNAQYRTAMALTDLKEKENARRAYQASMNALANEARGRFILRALYAPDQLREQMTWFWFNHFNVQAGKRDIRAMVGDYESTLRTGSLGHFRDLLEATLRHPAMLRYLENDRNAFRRINENYAREIMELHTMGVNSGYTQKDVQELARILTGVGISLKPSAPKLKPARQHLYIRQGLFEFNPARHDFGDKHFLGHVINGSGFAEVEQALDILAKSPATAHHISKEIATYFPGYSPPAAMAAQMTKTFQQTDGDIGQVLRTMIRTPEFAASFGKAFKDPVHYVISALRLIHGDRVILDPLPVSRWISRMGQGLYYRTTPDGYNLNSSAWTGPGQLLARFDIAREIGGNSAKLFRSAGERFAVPQIQNVLSSSGMDMRLSKTTQKALAEAANDREWNALFLSSPEFMHR